MKPSQRLVEAELVNGPGRHDNHHAVDRVDLTSAGVWGDPLGYPRQRGDLAPAELLVAVSEGRPGDGPGPPGDASNPHGAGATHDRHVRVAERVPHLVAEVGIDEL